MNNKEIFHENMEELGRKHERSKIYLDFMDYYIHEHSNSPDRKLPRNYTPGEMILFQDALHGFKGYMEELIAEHGWYDLIGEYYEEYILAGSKASQKGQFYTPRGISKVLSDIVRVDVSLGDAYDSACGSARNLLDYHYRNPEVRCVGEDLDESACKMAVINFHLHGVDGIVNWIDALTREYMGTTWRILEDRIYITDLDTIRANDEILSCMGILMLSDETLEKICKKFFDEVRGEVSPTMKQDKNHGGLDEWLR